MKTRFLFTLLLFAFCAGSAQYASAQVKPTSESAKAFLDFYYKGQGNGVVLADIQACMDVVEYNCQDAIDSTMLMTGTSYKIWMAFVVPEGDTVETLKVQFIKDGVIKTSRDMSVRGSIRYRSYRTFTPSEPGAWEIRVVNEGDVEVETVGSLQVVVG